MEDRLRKARTPLRAMLTKTVNEVKVELEKAKEDINENVIQLKMKKLESTVNKLQALDSQILDTMLDEDCTEADYQAEHDAIDKYEEQWVAVNIIVKKSPHLKPDSPASSEYSTAASVEGVPKKKTYKLPKIEIKRFNGELTDWLGYWSQFKRIHEDEDLHATDKFQYLVQSIAPGSRARELVESYPLTQENYPKVITALQERFGREDVLIELYVRELLQLGFMNATSRDKLHVSQIYDKLECHLRALESLGLVTGNYARIFYPMVESSLPEEVLQAWKRSPSSRVDGLKQNPPKTKLDLLMEFLKIEVENEVDMSLARAGFGLSLASKKDKSKGQKKSDYDQLSKGEDIPTAAGLFTGKGQSCIFCEGNHETKECGKADTLTLEQKKNKVKSSGACFICLKMGHSVKKCKIFVKCLLCHKKHQTIMCPEIQNMPVKSSPATKPPEQLEVKEEKTVSSAMNCTNEVLLKTLLVRMVGRGRCHVARLIFDDGSQRTYVKQSTVNNLQLEPCGQEIIRKALFGGTVTDGRLHMKYRIKLESLDGSFSREVEALDEPVVCGNIPKVPMGPWFEELKKRKIWINDHQSSNPDIEILVGSDYWAKFMTGKIVELNCGLSAVESKFGWTLTGPVPKNENVAMAVTALFVSNATIPEMWNLETIGIRDSVDTLTKEEKELASREHFKKTVTRNEEGRYSINLPWLADAKEIPNNKRVAEKRLVSATNKLKSAGKFEIYDQIFRDTWLGEGIIERVSENEIETPCHYLPHHPVFKPESLTTPVRPVFDASCKVGRAPSLNDCLEKGPNLLELIPAILLRFRKKKIGCSVDIRKAFQMIEVAPEDRDFLRFLWWEDGKQIEFRHCRVVFGVNCSPFLLAAVLESHLEAVEGKWKKVAQQLLESNYVDNCLTSVDTIEEYYKFKEVATSLLANARMELRQWECSAVEGTGIGSLVSRECGLGPDSMNIQEEFTSALGLKWNKVTDKLSCVVPQNHVPDKITKRTILSMIQRIFDPLGILCPALLPPKFMLQRAWSEKIDWDEDLGESETKEFKGWWKEVYLLAAVRIPRYYAVGNLWNNVEIHCFCDASKDAYAAVIFLRIEEENSISVQLLQAKSRVAPLKYVTIPRLELLSCTIAARLVESVKKALSFNNVPTFLWSDSTTALAWIRRNDEWGTFVGNRVKEICRLTDPLDWRHVPGVLNPADLPSRGCTPSQLLESCWWEGPDWLKRNKCEWPSFDPEIDEDVVMSEKRKSSIITMNVVENSVPWYASFSSSYHKNISIIAWIRRLLPKTRNHWIPGPLSVQEIEEAEKVVVRLVQKENFELNKSVVAGLEVEKDEFGILRVKTKLLNSQESRNFRMPMLMPHIHPIVDQIVREEHIFNCHGGAQFLMSKIREKFWIVQGRKAIRRNLRKCVVCRRFTTKSPEVPSAPLPADRVNPGRTFEVTGVDLAGPLFLKDKTKAWIVLFTCGVYRCVHLELVSSLTTDAFLLALERFISRRGRPRIIYSDNGTNFVGAVNLFKELEWKVIERETRSKRIEWKFNPPTAAWWGGWWERLIRTVKDLLKRMLGRSKLNYIQLQTMLCSAEATINNRPLTVVTEDGDDLIPLTPLMFLQDLTESDFPEAVVLEGDGLRRKYKDFKQMREELKMRFRNEYLSELVQRGKLRKFEQFNVGDVVLVSSDNKKRIDWPMARIVKILPGSDGEVRLARVKTSFGFFLRPLQRLYPLEISSPQEIPPMSSEVKKKAVAKEKKRKATVKLDQEVEVPQVVTRKGLKVKKPVGLEF